MFAHPRGLAVMHRHAVARRTDPLRLIAIDALEPRRLFAWVLATTAVHVDSLAADKKSFTATVTVSNVSGGQYDSRFDLSLYLSPDNVAGNADDI